MELLGRARVAVRLSKIRSYTLCSAAALLLSTSICFAQETYTNVPGHEPIWAVSVYGGYYDMTGVIQGSVATRDLPRYGGRFADGTPVSGAPKVRDSEGTLLDKEDYMALRQQLSQKLDDATQQLSDLNSGQGMGYSSELSPALAQRNLQTQVQDLQGQIATLDRQYSGYRSSPAQYAPGYGTPYQAPGISKLAGLKSLIGSPMLMNMLAKFAF